MVKHFGTSVRMNLKKCGNKSQILVKATWNTEVSTKYYWETGVSELRMGYNFTYKVYMRIYYDLDKSSLNQKPN